VDINQVYTAPSIPKLSKKNISSSVLRGATATTATPKLKTTKFSFIKPKISSETLKTDVSSLQVSESLSETNRILVEIQKQLALDFANRIAEEKEAIKRIKAAESKRKFASKEKSVEATKKISGALGGAIGKVTAPIKSVFDKIKEFFTLILTGIVLNAAFKWLQDDKNKQLLFTIFDWIGNAFVPAVIAIVGYKLFRLLRGIFQIGKWLLKLPGRLAKIFGIKGQAKPTAPTVDPRTRPKIKPQALRDLGKAAAPRPGAGTILSSGGKPLLGSGIDAYRGGTPGRAPSIPKLNAPVKPKGVGGGIIGNVAFVLAQLFAPQIQEAVGGLYNQMGIGMGNLSDEELKKQYEETYKSFVKYNSGQSSLPFGGNQSSFEEYEFGRLNLLQNEFKRRGLSFNSGGTIPGPKVNKDVTPVLATPGEEISNLRTSMLFRPLLKDLNNNAGRIWNLFSQAITKVINVTAIQKEVSDNFNRVIKDFDKYLKDDIAKKRTSKPGGGGGGFRVPSTKPRSISAAPRSTNVIINAPSGSGGMTFLPMVLPKQSSKPPQIPQMQGKATEVPVISPVNFANPWMDVTPELYGIQLYG